MARFITAFAEKVERELSHDERRALSVAYKFVVGIRRASWRVLSSIEKKESTKGNHDNTRRITQYRLEIESELNSHCQTVLSLLTQLLPRSQDPEATVLYYKMRGDYNRYMCEWSQEGRWKVEAKSAYEEGVRFSRQSLPPPHPIRLGLLLNYAVFEFEVCNNPEKACHIAKRAKDEVRDSEVTKEAERILLMLGDNVNMWSRVGEEEGE